MLSVLGAKYAGEEAYGKREKGLEATSQKRRGCCGVSGPQVTDEPKTATLERGPARRTTAKQLLEAGNKPPERRRVPKCRVGRVRGSKTKPGCYHDAQLNLWHTKKQTKGHPWN